MFETNVTLKHLQSSALSSSQTPPTSISTLNTNSIINKHNNNTNNNNINDNNNELLTNPNKLRWLWKLLTKQTCDIVTEVMQSTTEHKTAVNNTNFWQKLQRSTSENNVHSTQKLRLLRCNSKNNPQQKVNSVQCQSHRGTNFLTFIHKTISGYCKDCY